jgi:hypothetical protein
MTEAEWQACADAGAMFPLIEPIGTRKSRLLAAACGRAIGHLLGHPASRDAVEVIERGADGWISDDDWWLASYHAEGALFAAQQDREGSSMARAAAADFIHSLTCECLRGFPSRLRSEARLMSFVPAALIRDIFGNPFRPVSVNPDWRTSTVLTLAEGIYANRAFDRLPVLADALQDAGCDNDDVLAHCRGDGPHVHGCWVVDLVLGKE